MKWNESASFAMRTACATAVLVSLSACTSVPRMFNIKKEVAQNSDEATRLAARAAENPRIESVTSDFIPVDNGKQFQPLPKELLGSITFNQTSRDLRDFAAKLQAATGLRVDVMPDAMTAMQSGQPTLQTAASTLVPQKADSISMPSMGGGPMPPMGGISRSSSASLEDWRVIYEGPVHGLLDTVTRRFDVSWEVVDGVVVIKRDVVRTFRLIALAGAASGSSTISSTQSSGSSGGGSSGGGSGGGGSSSAGKSMSTGQVATLSFEGLSPWTAVETTVKSMLTTEGRLTVSAALGTITVIDRKSATDRIADFIRSTNEAMGRQVALNVKVYSVHLTEGDQYGLDWKLVYKSLKGAGISINNASPSPDTTASAFGIQVLNQATHRLNGTELLLKALSTQGHVSEQVSTTLVTLNNQPVPLQVVRQQSYLASVSVSQVAEAGTTTTLTPGQVNAGLDMSFVPHVQDDGRILLQYSMTLSDIESIDDVRSGTSLIQLPNVNLRSFIQRVSVNPGETLVMSGYQQTSLDSQQQGVGSPSNWLLGGSRKTERRRVVLVILVQPTLI